MGSCPPNNLLIIIHRLNVMGFSDLLTFGKQVDDAKHLLFRQLNKNIPNLSDSKKKRFTLIFFLFDTTKRSVENKVEVLTPVNETVLEGGDGDGEAADTRVMNVGGVVAFFSLLLFFFSFQIEASGHDRGSTSK